MICDLYVVAKLPLRDDPYVFALCALFVRARPNDVLCYEQPNDLQLNVGAIVLSNRTGNRPFEIRELLDVLLQRSSYQFFGRLAFCDDYGLVILAKHVDLLTQGLGISPLDKCAEVPPVANFGVAKFDKQQPEPVFEPFVDILLTSQLGEACQFSVCLPAFGLVVGHELWSDCLLIKRLPPAYSCSPNAIRVGK